MTARVPSVELVEWSDEDEAAWQEMVDEEVRQGLRPVLWLPLDEVPE